MSSHLPIEPGVEPCSARVRYAIKKVLRRATIVRSGLARACCRSVYYAQHDAEAIRDISFPEAQRREDR